MISLLLLLLLLRLLIMTTTHNDEHIRGRAQYEPPRPLVPINATNSSVLMIYTSC